MDLTVQSWLRTIGLSVICLLLIEVPVVLTSYSIGVGIADTTGPVADIVFLGYAKIEQKGRGLHLRTFSRAFIVDDGEERFVFVNVDSAMIGHGVRKAVLDKLKKRFGDMYTEENVMVSGIHTHSGPGGYMMDMLLDLTIFGFVEQSFNAIVNGITKSIERAHESMIPGRIFVAHGELLNANINRSPTAYLNNPKSERNKYKYNVDKIMTQLQFYGVNDYPLGVINWFAVHPTSMNNTNKLVSSDNMGYAAVLFEKMMNNNAMVGKGDFVAAFASSNLGDVSPNIEGPKCEFSRKPCSGTCPNNELCFASGPGKDMFESTSTIAHRLFKKAQNLWQGNTATEVTGPIRIVHQYVNMPEQVAEYYNQTSGNIEKVHGCTQAMGYSFAAGTTDGPGSVLFQQGTNTSNPLYNIIRNFLAGPTSEDISCHSPKPILLATGRMTHPYEWQPKIVSTQVALLGNVIIAGVPGELTTMSGRRLREAITNITNDMFYNNATVIVAGLCNTYSSYIATPEEYQVQRYEGASTIFGPHTLTIYLKQYQELAKAAIVGNKINAGPSPPDLLSENLLTLVTPVLYDTPKWHHEFGDCILQPQRIVASGDIVTVKFISGHPRNNLMTGSSFLTVERLEDDETWTVVATDADWETKFIWTRTSTILGSSEVTITWTIPEDIESGQYRIRHNGYYRYILGGVYPYRGVTNEFQVNSSRTNRHTHHRYA